MSKRKADDKDPTTSRMDVDGNDSGSDEDMDMLDVDFEWFDPQPQVDFHGLKTLLRQLFDVDHTLFNLSELADLILEQPLLGSTVKCDGNESDPFAFLTVLNLHQRREKPVIQELTKYLLEKSAQSSNPDLTKLTDLLSSSSSQAQVGLVLTERFINMPHQIVPPMYNMLLEEIQWAVQDKEPYEFTHYLIISKTYTEVASQLDAEESRPQKKSKGGGAQAEVFYFHPEDEVLHKHATGFADYNFTNQGGEGDSDSKRAFQELGVRSQGHMILLEAKGFEGAVKAVEQYLGGTQ